MIALPPGARVWLAAGHIDMRRGFDRLARQVQEVLRLDPFSGHLFVFRGRRCSLVKCLFWDTQGLVLYAKRLERGRFVWPKLSCRSCKAIAQAPALNLPIRRGPAGLGLLARVLVARYADHLPLYRQSGIYAREGVALDRSTLAD